MAKGKTVAMVWICQDCKKINGAGRVMKDKIKDLARNKYCQKTRKVEAHKAKLVKKAN